MKKKILAFVLASLMFFPVKSYGFESMQCIDETTSKHDVDAYSAIVMEMKSGRVLYGKNINQKLPMASTTKILTTLITLNQPDLYEKFTVYEKDFAAEGSSMGLRDNDMVSLEDLCWGMILPSGNDAANAAAVKISGSKEKFSELMNKTAEEIGMYDSHFVTPSGLDDDKHYSTAYDMAILTREAMKNPLFREICKSFTHKLMMGNPPTERTLVNYNKLLEKYDYCTGVKTGYTDNARRCLVSTACKNGIELIIVTLNCHNDFKIHEELYEYYFDKLKLCDISEFTENINVHVAGINRPLKAVPKDLPLVPLFDNEKENLKVKVTLNPIIYAPVKQGKYLGEIEIYSGDVVIYKTELISPVKTEILTKKTKKHFIFNKNMIK